MGQGHQQCLFLEIMNRLLKLTDHVVISHVGAILSLYHCAEGSLHPLMDYSTQLFLFFFFALLNRVITNNKVL